jgi:hypothetical protein
MQFDRAVTDGFIQPVSRNLIVQETDPDRLLDLLAAYKTPSVEKWIGREES